MSSPGVHAGSGRCVIFAGGGTGGHIFPGLAIAEQLDAIASEPGTGGPGQVRRVFLCSDRAGDARILGEEEQAFDAVPARAFSLRPSLALRFARGWAPSVRAAAGVIERERGAGRRVVLAAMGGFVAAPCARAARRARVPVLLVNLDAVPGKANRWIARGAARALSSADSPHVRRLGWEVIPPIVRRAALPPGPSGVCRALLGLDPDRPTLLVTGASQGAGTINRLMLRMLRAEAAAFRAWQVVHQTGAEGVEEIRAAYQSAGVRAHVSAFLRPMGPAWGAADLALSRAGAGSVAEAWANRVPTLFLPYPFHRDEHQRHNADPLVRAGSAVVSRDRVDAARNAAEGGRVLLRLMADAGARARMRAAFEALGPADGAARAARAVAELF